jgi:hypothetical protein
VFFFVEILESC